MIVRVILSENLFISEKHLLLLSEIGANSAIWHEKSYFSKLKSFLVKILCLICEIETNITT